MRNRQYLVNLALNLHQQSESFLKNTDKDICFISLENTRSWFEKNKTQIRSSFSLNNQSERISLWSRSDYNTFYKSALNPWTPIIDGSSRYNRWKRYMEVGPFYRFEKDSNSRFNNIIPPKIYSLFRPFIVSLVGGLRNFGILCHKRIEWIASISNKLTFKYYLVEPSMKDQFGESPNRDEYLNAGLKNIPHHSKSVLVMVDAGPRHYITEKILSIDNATYKINLCLFDAHRPEYSQVLNKFSGTFRKGNTCLYDGSDFYNNVIPDKLTRESILEKELWHSKS